MKNCNICPNNCLLEKGSICGRNNVDEIVVEATAIAIDPIEKKPLYHFYPGSQTLSVGTLGCNLRCLNCQNHSIAQPKNRDMVPVRRLSPEALVNTALENDLNSISWTYNEPSIYPEWIISTARIAEEYDIGTILVSNGYTSYSTLESLVGYVSAVNVDLKGDADFYENICRARLKDVQNSIEYYYDNNVHIELTNLLIPSLNDDADSVTGLCEYVHGISDSIPVHFSAFHPDYKLRHLPSTREESVLNACSIARDTGLRYVYPGNIRPSYEDNTYCEDCEDVLIERNYYSVENYITVDGKCPHCGSIAEEIII